MDLADIEDVFELTEHSALSPVITSDDTGLQVKRTYWLPWDSVEDAIANFRGYSEYDPAARTIQRYLPQRDPQFPSLRCTDVTIQGVDTATSEAGDYGDRYNVYTHAKMVATFGRKPYWWRTDEYIDNTTTGNEIRRYCEVNTRAEGDYLNVKDQHGLLRFAVADPDTFANIPALQAALGTEENGPLKAIPGKIVAQANIEVIWRQVPYDALPIANIYAALGKINKATFGDPADPTRYWDVPWTILFLGASWNLVTMADQNFAWDVRYLFKYKRDKYNYYFNARAATPAFYQVTNNGYVYDPSLGTTRLPDGASVYDEYDLKRLFANVA